MTPLSALRSAIRSVAVILLGLAPCAVAQEAPASPRADPTTRALRVGDSLERELSGDGSHSYRIVLRAGQYLHLVVEQRGIDVVVTLLGPTGEKVAEIDSPNGTEGPEPVSTVATATGNYRLRVTSLDSTAAPGHYGVRVIALRTPTRLDRARLSADDALAQATALRSQGTAQSLRQAIDKYEAALPFLSELGDWAGQAAAVNKIAAVYSDLGETRNALIADERSLPLYRAAGDRSGEGSALNNIGLDHQELGENREALDYLLQALSIQRATGNLREEGTTLHNLGLVYHALGDNGKALEYYDQALVALRSAGDQRVEASTLQDIGVAHASLGAIPTAIEFYQRSLTLSRTIGYRRGEVGALLNLAAAYNSLGTRQQSITTFTEALQVLRAAGDRDGEAYALTGIGLVHDLLGEKQLALHYYREALSLRRDLGDEVGAATLLHNIGTVFDDLGESASGLTYFAEALPLWRSAGDRRSEATTLGAIGKAHNNLGNPEPALQNYRLALSIFREIGDSRSEATTIGNMALAYQSQGDNEKARESFREALALYRASGDAPGEGLAMSHLGAVSHWLGQDEVARSYVDSALPILRRVGDRVGEASTLLTQARIERTKGVLDSAVGTMEASLAIIDSLRVGIGSQNLRSSYFATVQDFQEFYVDLLMQLHRQNPAAGYDARALQASERGRARSLLETLAEANADIRQGVDSTQLTRERELQAQLNAKAQRQSTLLAGPHTSEQAATVAREIDSLTFELEQAEAAIRSASPRYAALTQPHALDLRETQQLLDEGTVLLEYALGEQGSFVWAVTPSSITSYELAKAADIEAAARRFYEFLNSPNPIYQRRGQLTTADQQERLTAASDLSRMLLGPVAAQLGGKRLVVVADGALQYVPFAALPDPATLPPRARLAEPLIVRHEIVSLPSMSVLATLRSELAGRHPAPEVVAVIADPVFAGDDERVARRTATADTSDLSLALLQSATESGALRSGDRLVRLPGTRQEAQGILALAPAAQSRGAFDFEASRRFATSGALSRYRYVHFATHGLLNSLHPELSALVLSMVDSLGDPEDGFLRAHEIYNLTLPADLVVLSGCQTGLGKEVKGEGLIGMTRGFFYAGAARVMMSLWKVDDEATARLMVDLYTEMLRKGKRPAEALRAAQLAMWRSDTWQAPYYWAAFTLQGEWN